MGKKKSEAKEKREVWTKHGYRMERTRHGVVSQRKGKTERKAGQRAERAVVRGKFRKAYPDAPSSREQARKRPEKPTPPKPKPKSAVTTTAPTEGAITMQVTQTSGVGDAGTVAPPPPAPPPPPAARAEAVKVDGAGRIKGPICDGCGLPEDVCQCVKATPPVTQPDGGGGA